MTDPHLWLEDVLGDDALAWVRERNERTKAELEGDPDFEALRKDLLAILDSDERIPFVAKHGDHYYNFWQDATNPRGIWRRTTPDEYRKPQPEWEVVLDVDALNVAEGENWVFHGTSYLEPDESRPYERVLLDLSRGGSDADVTREFDLTTKSFVDATPERSGGAKGFFRPEAKGGLSWIDRDTVYVFTDFGAGSLTSSGYPRIVKEWKRGTSLEEATVVYEGDAGDMYIAASHDQTRGFERDFVSRTIAFYNSELYLRESDVLHKVDVPNSAEKGVHREWLMLRLRDPWDDFPAGAVIVAPFDAFMSGGARFDVVYEPDDHSALIGASWTKNHLLVNVLRDVRTEVSVLTPSADGWHREPLLGAPSIGTVGVGAIDDEHSDEYFMQTTDFLTPSTLLIGTVGAEPEAVKSLPAFFEIDGLGEDQRFTTSDDGTRVPYFVVGPKDGGPRPTLLYGYGGFENPMLPSYLPTFGRGWLASGGVFVMACIRGGGEYGPRWHQAALREKRFRAYEDFAAIARELIAEGVTTREQLACMGGSNGGLLVGNMLTRYPDLFGAIVCQVPLLDMQRYHQLLAGASWMAEYGNPDKPEDWAFMEGFSPYHNVHSDVRYPPVLFITSTKDDRVHPGHARKMMARMEEQGHDVRYYENVEGGHGAAADNAQRAYMQALDFTFLTRTLGLKRELGVDS